MMNGGDARDCEEEREEKRGWKRCEHRLIRDANSLFLFLFLFLFLLASQYYYLFYFFARPSILISTSPTNSPTVLYITPVFAHVSFRVCIPHPFLPLSPSL
jgi:hypothetical protein